MPKSVTRVSLFLLTFQGWWHLCSAKLDRRCVPLRICQDEQQKSNTSREDMVKGVEGASLKLLSSKPKAEVGESTVLHETTRAPQKWNGFIISGTSGDEERSMSPDEYTSVTSQDVFTFLADVFQTHITVSQYSCVGMCGEFQNLRCSCQPSCVSLKTCCIDFVDVCAGDRNSLIEIERNLTWLKQVTTQCYFGNVIVDSCPITNLSNSSDWNLQANERIDKFIPYDILNNKNPIELMSKVELTENLHVNIEPKLQWLLAQFPVEDASIGVTFRNNSIYQCNSRPWQFARPWAIRLQFKRLVTQALTQSLESILSVFDQDSVVSAHQYTEDLDLKSTHPCQSDLVSGCPTHFPDDQVKQACHYTYYPLMLELDKKTVFKNPYCLACNAGLNKEKSYTRPAYALRVGFARPMFTLSPDKISINLDTVLTFHGEPAWRSIECNLTTKTSDKEFEADFGVDVDVTTNVTKGTTCTITECDEYTSETLPKKCEQRSFLTLHLPQSARPLDYFDFQDMFEDFQKRFTLAMSGWNIAFTKDFRILRMTPYEFESRQMQYYFYGEISSDARLLYFSNMLPWDTLNNTVLAGSKFPFTKENLYFCLGISLVHPSIREVFINRCWDVTERSGALIIDNTSHLQSHGSRIRLNLASFAFDLMVWAVFGINVCSLSDVKW